MEILNHRGLSKFGFLAIILAASGGSVWAFPTSNNRPVTVSGTGLQTELNSIFGLCPSGSCVNAVTNQSAEGMWQTSTLQNPTVTAVLQATDVPSGDTFGLFTDPNQLVPLIYGNAAPTDSLGFSTAASLQWSATGALRITSPGGDCGYIDCTTVTDIAANSFGFYLQTPTGTYYTVDALNQDGGAQALTYNYNNEWVLAFNDTPVTASAPGAYTDFVVGVQSISGLPEPRSIYLLGTTLPLLALMQWRRSRRGRKA
jgi:hypothetical protein